MKKIFTSTFIILFITFCGMALKPISANAEDAAVKPKISITNTPAALKDDQPKPITVKTTIVTKKIEEIKEQTPTITIKKEKKDIDLSSDVDKILKEMDIDDTDPLTEAPATPAETIYKPVKKNFMWFAFGIILFPIILFALLLKAMKTAKTRFEKEEKEESPSKEEQFLQEIQKEQKKSNKKHRSLAEILGGSKPKPTGTPVFDDEFDREEEDFEFMVEEVILVEEHKAESPKAKEEKTPSKPEPQHQPQPEQNQQKEEEPAEITDSSSDVIDSFEISENLKFNLIRKDEAVNLMCKLNDREILIMKLEKAQKFNKVRKIDSKPGRDVYMVKLDSWRGLVEIKEDSVKYLMDI